MNFKYKQNLVTTITRIKKNYHLHNNWIEKAIWFCKTAFWAIAIISLQDGWTASSARTACPSWTDTLSCSEHWELGFTKTKQNMKQHGWIQNWQIGWCLSRNACANKAQTAIFEVSDPIKNWKASYIFGSSCFINA